jgi:hypothetical protein
VFLVLFLFLNFGYKQSKKVEPNSQEQQDILDLKLSVSEIQKQMTTIHEKIEILLNRIK